VRALRSLPVVVDAEDLEPLFATRRAHRDDVADPVPEESTGDWRDERDEARGRVRLVDAHDRDHTDGTVVAADTNPSAEPDLAGVCRRRRQHGRCDSRFQLGAAKGDGVVVQFRLDGIECGQLVAKRLESSRRDVVRCAYGKRRAVTWDLGRSGAVVLGEGLDYVGSMPRLPASAVE
jgi:hypothetical protein